MIRVGIADVGPGDHPAIEDTLDLSGAGEGDQQEPQKAPSPHGRKVTEVLAEVATKLAPNERLAVYYVKLAHNDNEAVSVQRFRAAADWFRTRKVAAANFSVGDWTGFLPSEVLIAQDAVNRPSEGPLGLTEAFRHLYESGTIPVVAAGNGMLTKEPSAPTMAVLSNLGDLPWVVSVGATSEYSAIGSDVVESAANTSFTAPQTTLKAALLRERGHRPDLVVEAILTTCSPTGGSAPRVHDPSPDELEAVPSAARLVARFLRDPLLSPLTRDPKVAPIMANVDRICEWARRPGYGCDVRGRCGWGYPRIDDARAYAKRVGSPQWYRAGSVPLPVEDPRWAAWAPFYALRLRHAGYTGGLGEIEGARGSIDDRMPIGAGLFMSTGVAGYRSRAGGASSLGGFGPVHGREGSDGLFVDADEVVFGAWFRNGRWVAVTQGRARLAQTGLKSGSPSGDSPGFTAGSTPAPASSRPPP